MKRENLFFIVTIVVLLIIVFILGAMLIFGRSGTAEVLPTQTRDAAAVSTSIAQTVEAELTETAGENPQPTPDCNCPTPEPTDAETATPSPTPPPPATVTPTVPAAFDYHAEFIQDVTVPDGSQFSPGVQLTKTWRVRNIGGQTWTTDFALVFISGDRMEGAPKNIPVEVPPGGQVDLTVDLIAPDEAGEYQGFWMLSTSTDDDAVIFGIGTDAQQALFVLIEVVEATATPGGATATPGQATSTPGALSITPGLTVNNNAVTAACPYTFTFSANFTANRATSLTWEFEASDDNGQIEFDLGGPFTSSIAAANTPVTEQYTLTVSASMTGAAQVNVTNPLQRSSPPVAFSLTCQ